MKIDRRISYKIMLDVETCPLDKDFEGVCPHNMWVYDIGFAVIDNRGKIYETYSYIVKDIFFGEKELMKSSYYANKLPQYYDDIRNGSRIVKSWYEIRQILADVMAKYNATVVIAHNARFDDIATKNTQKWLTKSKYRYFLQYETEVWDTLKMCHDTVAKQPSYRRYCERNGYLTKNNQVRLTAEIVYRYISGNEEFVESHTGLEDVLIESQIFAYCMRQHKAMRKKLYA